MELSGVDLTCDRGGRRVFSRINFLVRAGDALVLTGPNGAGKSSLLRVIAGLIHPVEGTVSVVGGDDDLSVAEQTHYLGHLDPLKPALTVMENLTFWTRFLNGKAGAGNTEVAEGSLKKVGLADLGHLPAGYLSAGQRRRLSLARILASARPIWLLDEPTTALDAASQDGLRVVMRDHLSGGGIVLAATHAPLGLEGAIELRLGPPVSNGVETVDTDSPSAVDQPR